VDDIDRYLDRDVVKLRCQSLTRELHWQRDNLLEAGQFWTGYCAELLMLRRSST
jgi:hypothetical protein